MAETVGPRQSDSRASGCQDLRSDATCPPCSGSSVLRFPGSPLPAQGSSRERCWARSQVLTTVLSFQCQVTVLTEPSPPPQPPPTSGSEQIGFLKTINCSCPAGEKVPSTVHPQPPAQGPRAEWGRVVGRTSSGGGNFPSCTWAARAGWPQAPGDSPVRGLSLLLGLSPFLTSVHVGRGAAQTQL